MAGELFRATDAAWEIEQYINLFVPIITAIIAVAVALCGYKHGLKQQAKDHQHQFQIRLYEKLTATADNLSSAISSYNALLLSFGINVSMDYEARKDGHNLIDWKRRPEDYTNAHFGFTKSVVRLIQEIESVDIIEPKLKIFRIALSSVVHDVTELYNKNSPRFFNFSSKDLIQPDGNKVTVSPNAIDEKTRDTIKSEMAEMSDKLLDGSAYLTDLSVDLQNLLLGEIFVSNKVKHREPIDPNKVVICTARYEELEKHFRENTNLGKQNEKIISEVKEQFGAK